MREHPGRLIVFVLAMLAVFVAATAAYLLLPARQTARVAVPPRDASSEQVVAAYLAALNAHDCGTAEALMTPDAQDQVKFWCESVANLKAVDIDDHFMEGSRGSGRSASSEVAHVSVTFDLSYRLFHDDDSMPAGPTAWGYLLVRDSADSPWRIFGQGNG